MAWTNVDLKDVSTQIELLPQGVYTFEIAPGAKYDERNGAIKLSATVVGEGEFVGKRVFFSYPDPESVSSAGKPMKWSATAFKRLTQALGEDPSQGEDHVAYLNRIAGSRFATSITHTPATDQYPNPSVSVNLFNVRPAA